MMTIPLNHGKPWLAKMMLRADSCYRIAANLGRSQLAVECQSEKLGLNKFPRQIDREIQGMVEDSMRGLYPKKLDDNVWDKIKENAMTDKLFEVKTFVKGRHIESLAKGSLIGLLEELVADLNNLRTLAKNMPKSSGKINELITEHGDTIAFVIKQLDSK